MTQPTGQCPDDLIDYPMNRRCPMEPAPEYALLRDRPGMSQVRLQTGMRAWAVVKANDVRQLLTDKRFSANASHPGFPHLAEHMRPTEDYVISLVSMDGDVHHRTRTAITREFTLRRTRKLQPRIDQIVNETLDAMLAGPKPVNLVEAFTYPISLLLVCDLLGVPFSDRDDFRAWSAKILSSNTPEESGEALMSLYGYIDRLVTAKKQNPTPDALSRTIHRPDLPDTLDHIGFVAMGFMLFMAGHDTPSNAMAMAIAELLRQPETLDKLKAQPEKWPVAVEEILRYFVSTEAATSRVALEDVEIGGVTVKAGDGLLGLINGANRDPLAFPDPDRFDIDRNPKGHLGFGAGQHKCLGQHMARAVMITGMEALFRRVPTLRYAGTFDDIVFKDDHDLAYGVIDLPVTW